jgi:hypothetical protein
MRAAIILGGMLIASSVVAGGASYDANGLPQMEAVKAPAKQQVKTAVRVSKETRMSEGSLEKFGVTGLAQ